MDCFPLRSSSFGGQVASLAMTSVSIPAALFARVLQSDHPRKREGAGNGGATTVPAALRANEKRTQASHHRYVERLLSWGDRRPKYLSRRLLIWIPGSR